MKIFKRFVLMGLRLQSRCWSRAYSRRGINSRSHCPRAGTIYSIPIPENEAPSIEQIHEFMVRLRDAPEPTKIVVFCQSGKGRTACMGAAYWIAKCLTTSAAITRMSKACSATDWVAVERRRSLRSLKTP